MIYSATTRCAGAWLDALYGSSPWPPIRKRGEIMAQSEKTPVDRRGFLKGAAAGAALAAQAPIAAAQQVRGATPVAAKPAPETTSGAEKVEVLTNERPGADFMLEVIKSLGIEYATANPSSGS